MKGGACVDSAGQMQKEKERIKNVAKANNI